MVSKHREAGRPTRGGPWVWLGPGSSRGTVGETLPQGLKLITGSQPNPSWQQKELMLSFLGEKTCPSAPGGIHLWGKRVKWSQLSGRGGQQRLVTPEASHRRPETDNGCQGPLCLMVIRGLAQQT